MENGVEELKEAADYVTAKNNEDGVAKAIEKLLIRRLKDRLGGYTLIFDSFSVLALKKAKNHPSLKKTGAKIHWGIDDAKEVTKWGIGMQFVDEVYFTSNKEVKNLDAGTKTIFRIASLFPAAKKAHRILIYQIG